MHRVHVSRRSGSLSSLAPRAIAIDASHMRGTAARAPRVLYPCPAPIEYSTHILTICGSMFELLFRPGARLPMHRRGPRASAGRLRASYRPNRAGQPPMPLCVQRLALHTLATPRLFPADAA